MIEYKDGKEYWNGHECDGNFIFRTLADMFPTDYELYQKESIKFKKNHMVLSCHNCGYKCVVDKSNVAMETTIDTICPLCKTTPMTREL